MILSPQYPILVFYHLWFSLGRANVFMEDTIIHISRPDAGARLLVIWSFRRMTHLLAKRCPKCMYQQITGFVLKDRRSVFL